MDLIRQAEFFDPLQIKDEIHIIGVGAIGSHIAEILVRMGLTNIFLYDFDTVDAHNIPNQMFRNTDIGIYKVEALKEQLLAINPDVNITTEVEGYVITDTPLSGYVFLCVDSIDLRRTIVNEQRFNKNIKAMFDFRMGLQDAQHYAAAWDNNYHITKLLSSMNFTDEEAKAAMPTSACGSALSVIPTIRVITAYGISNFINYIKNKELKTTILADAFNYFNTVFSSK